MRNFLVLMVVFAMVTACVGWKERPLFENQQTSTEPQSFHSAALIYDEFLTSESWSTKSPDCITVKATPEAARTGELGIQITWNRQGAGCPWLGFGFGWDAWTGKDLQNIKNEGALEFWVRMPEGSRGNIPWAVGFEDFTGASAWLGVSANAIKAEKIGTEWVRVEMPLGEFNWREQDADISNIKQVIFQVEAAGTMYIDDIQLVPYTGGYRKRANIPVLSQQFFDLDGQKSDVLWQQEPILFGNNSVRLGLIDNQLCIALEVTDPDPLINNNLGNDIYNGDAFEIAFSSNPAAANTRTHYFSTDHHIGIALGKDIRFWNWQEQKPLEGAQAITKKTANGYLLEAKIDLTALEITTFKPGTLLGLEMAVDHGNAQGRYKQERWNDPLNEGFNTSPARWGELYILPPNNN